MIDSYGCLSCSLKVGILSYSFLSSVDPKHTARHSEDVQKVIIAWTNEPEALIQGSLQIPAGQAWRIASQLFCMTLGELVEAMSRAREALTQLKKKLL